MHNDLNLAAYITSKIVHPINIGCLTLFIVNTIVRGSILLAVIDTSILLLCLLPGILYLKKTRKYDNNKHKSYAMCILLAGVGITTIVYSFIGAEATQIKSLYIGILPGVLVIPLHRRYNISLHAATAMACVALLLPVSSMAATLLSFPAIAVGLARLPIQQHTFPQVFSGWVYGFGIITLLLRITS